MSDADPMSSTPYEQLGGEAMVRRLCARFYALMDSLPAAAPPLYTDKYGHPRLRMRHFVAPIGQAEVEGWLLCFHQAWGEIVPPSPLASTLLDRIDALGWHMLNKQEGA